jgi:hypothetical protein
MATYANKFVLFQQWTRKGIAAVLAPETVYRPGISWHSSRAVRFGHGPNYVLFANLLEGEHPPAHGDHFNIHGILAWHSGPLDQVTGKKGQDLSAHNPEKNEVLLFVRSGQSGPYFYLGRLGNPTHFAGTNKPYRLDWKLLDIKLEESDFTRIGTSPIADTTVAEPPDQPLGHFEPPNAVTETVWEPQQGHEPGHPPPPVESPDFAPAHRQATHEGYEEEEMREIFRMLRGDTPASPPVSRVPLLLRHKSPWEGQVGETRFASRFLRELKTGQLALDAPPKEAEQVLSAVVNHERGLLLRANRPDLAEKVHAGEEGDFSVVFSSDPAKGPFPILVKATTGPDTTPFFLSMAEMDFLKSAVSSARIYRIYGWNSAALSVDFFEIKMPFYAEGVEI